jgi:2-aminoadipate transaminase
MHNAPESFLEELFRVSGNPDIISFAGGLPNSDLIDVEGIAEATRQVTEDEGREALQYSTTDGYRPLRQYIADRYKKRLGINVDPDAIQIVNGSQQCLDLVAKIFLDSGDHVGMEQPGYLGAIEAFSLYQPVLHSIALGEGGPDISEFTELVTRYAPKFFYGIPNSQNPSGQTYSGETRRIIAEILEGTDTIFYEDDAFGELFFDHKPRKPITSYIPDQAILSGSFSKIIAPGMRIGWIYAPKQVISQFNIAKQAADLHSNFLCQKILHRYLEQTDLDRHVHRVASQYGKQCRLMCDLIDDLLPSDVSRTTPKGGMFLMATLPERFFAMEVFREGVRQKVAVLPGAPFYVGRGGDHTIRLNFSSPSEEEIKIGMDRLSKVFARLG